MALTVVSSSGCTCCNEKDILMGIHNNVESCVFISFIFISLEYYFLAIGY